MARSRTLSQCLDIQNLAYETAMGFKTLEPSDDAIERHARKCVALAQVARAWEAAADRARILRGRPLPGSLRPKLEKKPTRYDWPVPAMPLPADMPAAASVDTATEAS